MSDVADQATPGGLGLILKSGTASNRMSAVEPLIQRVNDRFARDLRSLLLQHLRRGVAVTLAGVELVEYRTLIERLPSPTHLTLFTMRPLQGTMALMIEAPLVVALVESRFGGNGRFPINMTNREFTPFELKSMQRTVEASLEQLVAAWELFGRFGIEILRHESKPQFAGFADDDDLMLISSFDVAVDQANGRFDVCIPNATIEALQTQLATGGIVGASDPEPQWSEMLTAGVARATIPLKVELGEIKINVGELAALRPGTIFEMDRPERLVVESCGVPLFRGRWGRHGRKIGVLVEECLRPSSFRTARTDGTGEDD
jgi:flagellar motor switch protein FliM